MPTLIDLIGNRFGKLTVVSRAPNKSRTAWRCRCQCGRETTVIGQNLIRGCSQSCGDFRCRPGEYHGHSHGTPTYHTWRSMLKRCYDPKHEHYPDYGGRGINVCERWRISFKAFLDDMGVKPQRHVIDRKDFNGNYEPGNCRWATYVESIRNRRKPRKVYPHWLYTSEAVAKRVASMLRKQNTQACHFLTQTKP